jgi:SAM-dependent methyltransferase
VREELFDLASEYETMLQSGVGLSGEDRYFFILGRVRELAARLPAGWSPSRVLDFGCGIGTATDHLATVFRTSTVVGVDLAEKAISYARERYGSARVTFEHLSALRDLAPFDLCYVNGVFHHIASQNRAEALALIRSSLAPGGYLALFENNPWNPGTRMVMSRIPFDRDAIPIAPPELKSLVIEAGFRPCQGLRFLFYFPRALAVLRVTEPLLVHVPLGAQYYCLAQR